MVVANHYPSSFDDFYELREHIIRTKYKTLTRLNQQKSKRIKLLNKYLVLIKWAEIKNAKISNFKIVLVERNTVVHIEYYLFNHDYIIVATLKDILAMPLVNYEEWHLWKVRLENVIDEVMHPNLRICLKRCKFDKVMVKTTTGAYRCNREVCFCSLLISHNQTLNPYENAIPYLGALNRLPLNKQYESDKSIQQDKTEPS